MDVDVGTPTVLSKVASILGVFGAGRHTVTLTELSRQSGLPLSTVHRLSVQLVNVGLLQRSSQGLRLGTWVFELGQLVPERAALREVALPFLEDLHLATKQTVHLAVLDGADVVYVEKLAGHRGVQAPSRVGGRYPAVRTALGMALLAYTAPGRRAGIIEQIARESGELMNVSSLQNDIRVIRSAGVAVEHGKALPGVSCVAAPVLDGCGSPIAAVSLTTAGPELDQYVHPVRLIANRIGQAMQRQLQTGGQFFDHVQDAGWSA